MSRFFKFSGIALGVPLLVLIMAVTAAMYLLETNLIQKKIQNKIDSLMPGSITWKSFSYSLWKGLLEIKGAQLWGPQGEKYAGFESLRLHFSWTWFSDKEISIQEFSLNMPSVKLEFDSSGALMLLNAFPEREPDTNFNDTSNRNLTFNILVKSFKINNCDVFYNNQKDTFQAGFDDINLLASGNYKKRKGSLRLNTGSGTVIKSGEKIDIQKLSLSGDLSAGSLNTVHLEVRTAESLLKLDGAVKKIFDKPQAGLKLKSSISLKEIGKLTGSGDKMNGKVSINLNVTGDAGKPDIEADVRYSGGEFAGESWNGAYLGLSLKKMRAHIDSLSIEYGKGSLILKGMADLDKAFPNGFMDSVRYLDALAYNLSLVSRNIDLSRFNTDNRILEGMLNGTIILKGKGVDLSTMKSKLTADITIDELRADTSVKSVNVSLHTKAEIAGNKIDVYLLELGAEGMVLSGQGNYALKNEKVSAELMLAAPDLFNNLKPFEVDSVFGSLKLDANLSGTIESPKIDVIASITGFKTGKYTLGDVKIMAGMESGGDVVISRLELINRGSTLEAKGRAGLLKNGKPVGVKEMSYELKINGAVMLKDFLDSLAGTINIESEISGLGMYPTGKFHLKGDNLDLGVEKISEINMEAEFDSGTVNIKPLKVTLVPGEYLELTGRVSLDSSYSVSLRSPGINLSSLKSMGLSDSSGGIISLEFAGQGTFSDPVLNGYIEVRKFIFNGSKLDDIKLKTEIREQTAHVYGTPGFDLDGLYHLKTMDFEGRLGFNKTPLEPYFQLAGRQDLTGSLTGKIEASGNAKKMEELIVSMNFENLLVSFQQRPIIQSKNLAVNYIRGSLDASSFNVRLLEKGALTVSGTGEPDGPWDYKISGKIPLEVVRPFVPDLSDISGLIDIKGVIKKTAKKPEISMSLDLRDISFTIPGSAQKLHSLNGNIEASPELIEIDEVTAKVDNGTLKLAGKTSLKEFKPQEFSVNLNAFGFPVSIPDMLDIEINGDLEAAGNMEKSSITGTITLLKGLYYKDVDDLTLSILKGMGTKTRKTVPSQPKEKSKALKNVAIDIYIKNRDLFMINNNIAQMAISPDLSLTGNLSAPAINGRAEVKSGNILFLKKEFVIRKGVIDFLNPYKIEPTLDLISDVDVRDGAWLITLKMTGTSDEPVFKLSSDPPEKDEDIISLLLTGKTLDEIKEGKLLNGKKTPQQLLREAITKLSEKGIKKSTGLDIIKIETGTEKETVMSDQVKVTMGKQLSRRLTTKYSVESNDGKVTQKAIAEYKFLENLLISGYQDTKGIYGGEVQIILEFR